jgi:hypothetical protein
MLDGQYFHEGYVTRNLDRAREGLSRLYGMRFETLDASGAVQTPDGPAKIKMKLALGWHANLEIELIEPLAGHVDFYREMLGPDHTPRLHHTGVLVDDWARLETEIAAQGLRVVSSGDLGEIKYAYVDTRAALGHYVEYMWMSDAMWAARCAGTSTADLDRLQVR